MRAWAATTAAIALTGALAARQAQPPAAQAPDRSTPPKAGPPPELKLPPIDRQKLSNGLAVWVVEMHEVPVVQVTLVLETGSADDPADKLGVASFTSAMLDEGAGSRSALEIADAVDYLGASLVTGSSYDASVVRLGVPVARLGEALPIMADVALRPTFPETELTRLRRERLTAMLQARDNPSAVASEAFPRLLFGREHRYGTLETGTPASLSALSASDLRAFYESHYRPDRATLLVVGDVRPADLMPLLESGFGGWTRHGSAAAPATVPQAPEPAQRRVVIVDKPDAAQSQIRIGWVGVARNTPDYFALTVLNTILGGSFSSRLNQNLREAHGYAYGAGSGFSMRRSAGPFVAGAGVQTDKTADALREFFNELNGMLRPVPQEELERAKNYLAFSFPGDFETTGDLSARLQEMVVYDLPMDYFEHYVDRLQAVTAADVQRVAEKYIVPGRFLVVVVGDAKTIESPIRALNLGAVNVMTIEDVLGPPPSLPAD